ncbi:MAG TPA: CRTAC1 family protein [Bryobacteraceae bacterium]|nr:CRTAC1 family protein [Bryobacteraceae bacterium]
MSADRTTGGWIRTALIILGLASVSMAPPARVRFENIVASSGISFVLDNDATPQKHQIETMIAGTAVFDYNNDGLPDLYFVNGAAVAGMDKSSPRFYNRLYKNNGNGTFTDVTDSAGLRGAGYGMGIGVGDYDNDGYEDVFVAGVNQNQLFHNNGNGTFTDVTAKAGLAGVDPKLGKTWSVSAGWFDYDNDGYLDLIVVNYVRWSPENEPACFVEKIRGYCSPSGYEGDPSMLFHNNGDGTFTDVSDKSGIGRHVGKGMGVAFADYDGDGFTDIFVANDTFRNFLFHNNGNGTFTETAILAGVAYNEDGKSIAGMGTDFRDIDNDGKPDIFVVGMLGDTFPLFRNRGRYFEDITRVSGVAKATVGLTAWGAGIFDFDNDGHKDIFAACAAILDNSEEIDHVPSKLPNLLLRNQGNGTFVDVSAEAGSAFVAPDTHRGAAFGDLNNDGKMDIVVTNLNGKPDILINRSQNANHWLIVNLVGTKSNRDGLGARIKVVPATGPAQYNHATTSVGYGGSSDRRVHFGLGAATSVEKLEITWPSGIHQTLMGVKADQILTVREK